MAFKDFNTVATLPTLSTHCKEETFSSARYLHYIIYISTYTNIYTLQAGMFISTSNF